MQNEETNKENETSGTIEMSTFCCGHCMSEKWDVYIGRNEEQKKDFIVIRCGNPECVKEMEAELAKLGKIDETDSILWKIYDVTGQLDSENMMFIPNTCSCQSTDSDDDPNNLN